MYNQIQLKYCHFTISDEAVVCVFTDGTKAELDITNSHGPNYRGTAFFWGYDDHVLYAKHHDLLHAWLCERLYNQPSGTLWAVAHGHDPDFIKNREEEHLVNTVQWALAQGRIETYASYFEVAMGRDWVFTLVALKNFLLTHNLWFGVDDEQD